MTALATILGPEMERLFLLGACVFMRVGSAMAVMPLFGEQAVPARLRLAVAFAFTFVLVPALAGDGARAPAGTGTMLVALGIEMVAGLVLGLILRFLILALQTAGAIVAQSTSLAQMFGGLAGEAQPTFSHLYTLGALALAAMSGLHVLVAGYLLNSYRLIGIGVLPSGEVVAGWGIDALAQTFVLGLRIAGPFVLAGLVYNLALGFVNRAMPQVMATMVAAPATAFGAILLVLVAMPAGLMLWRDVAFDVLTGFPVTAP